jgi:hypothetical protein
MKNGIGLILGFLLLCSCNRNVVNTDNVVGKYINTFESDAMHYVELKADSTFLHYYKKGAEIQQENKGTWQLLKSDKKNEIVFRTWVAFGINKKYDCNGCIRYVKLMGDEMIFNVDLPNEMNFKKEE